MAVGCDDRSFCWSTFSVLTIREHTLGNVGLRCHDRMILSLGSGISGPGFGA